MGVTKAIRKDGCGGSSEEQVAEVVQNGMSGTIAGRGKPVLSGHTDLMRRRGAKPTRGAPVGIVFLRFHFPSKELAWMRVTEGAANPPRDVNLSPQGGGHELCEHAESQDREVQGCGWRDERQASL